LRPCGCTASSQKLLYLSQSLPRIDHVQRKGDKIELEILDLIFLNSIVEKLAPKYGFQLLEYGESVKI
jgi:hypothetical protein